MYAFKLILLGMLLPYYIELDSYKIVHPELALYGDTFTVLENDKTYRLMGLWSPKPNRKGIYPTCAQDYSKKQLRRALNTAGFLYIKELQNDPYGNKLVHAFLPDKTNLAELMLYNGAAYEVSKWYDHRYERAYRYVENIASIDRTGLWEICSGDKKHLRILRYMRKRTPRDW